MLLLPIRKRNDLLVLPSYPRSSDVDGPCGGGGCATAEITSRV